LQSKVFLEGLYKGEHLSAREIARLAGASRSTVLEAVDRFGVPRNENGHKRTGHVPFGLDYLNHQLVKNSAEQAAIRMMRQYKAGGLSLREIAGNLSQRLIPTKKNGIWQANTVRGHLPVRDTGSSSPDLRSRWSLSGIGLGRLRVAAPQPPCWGAALEEGQRRAARMPRVSGPGGRD